MADVCEGYTYVLAAEDVIPIVLGGIGFFCLARRITATFPQLKAAVYFAATILVIGSAMAGPIRKTFLAGGAGCDSLDWMQIPFFSALPIGFAILCWAVSCLLRDRKASFLPFGILLAVVFAGAAVVERSLLLIIVGGLLAVATGIECVFVARRQKESLTAVLFVLYSVSTLALPALGSNDNRSAVASQWTEQGTNTVIQTLFALATYRLLRAYQRTENRSAPVEI